MNELAGAGFITIEQDIFGIDTNTGFELKRAIISLTEKGSQLAENIGGTYGDEVRVVEEFTKKLAELGNPDYISLSIAAKTHLILKKEGTALNNIQIKERATKLGWRITDGQIEKATDILEKLGLAERV